MGIQPKSPLPGLVPGACKGKGQGVPSRPPRLRRALGIGSRSWLAVAPYCAGKRWRLYVDTGEMATDGQSGVAGFDISTSGGHGTLGSSVNSSGAHGRTLGNGSYGVYGTDQSTSGGYGVCGTSSTGVGVLAQNTGAGTALAWNGSTWTEQAPAAHPLARRGASMAYDPATSNIVLFGGHGHFGCPCSGVFFGDAAQPSSRTRRPVTSPAKRKIAGRS